MRRRDWWNLPHAHLQNVTAASLQPPQVECMPIRYVNSGKTSSLLSPINTSLNSLPSIGQALPRHQVHQNLKIWVKCALHATAFLDHPQQVTTTGDCISTGSCKTDSTGILSRLFSRAKFVLKPESLSLLCSHACLSSPFLTSMLHQKLICAPPLMQGGYKND